MSEIRYKRNVQSVAMNKWPNQSGIELVNAGDRIAIYAINPKTNFRTTQLRMELPKEEIDNFIQELIKLK